MKSLKLGLAVMLSLGAGQAFGVPIVADQEVPASAVSFATPIPVLETGQQTMSFAEILPGDDGYNPMSTTHFTQYSLAYFSPDPQDSVSVPEPGTLLLLASGLLLLGGRRKQIKKITRDGKVGVRPEGQNR